MISEHENVSPVGRPIKIITSGEGVEERLF